MNIENAHKIDPRLRKKNAQSADAFVEVATSEAMEWLRTRPWIRGFVQIVDGYCSASVGIAHLGELAQHPGVIEVEAVRSVRLHLDHSIESVHGWDGLAREKDRQRQGAGVVIGIIDYGLDFRLKDFRDSSGKSRVRYLWDQGLKRQGKEKCPGKYGYGVEYSSEDIDAALRRPDPLKIVRHDPFNAESAISGHGTHVAGIAAGNGTTADKAFPARTYVGVAPAATLVFVHLNRDAVLAQVEDPRGTLGNSVNLAHAIAYCFEKADELNMPCVINLSMGFNGGGHDGNLAVEWIIDSLLAKSGRAVVFAAGNEHRAAQGIHRRGRLKKGERASIAWENGLLLSTAHGVVAQGDASTNEVEIWYSNKSELKVRLSAPGGDDASGWMAPGDAAVLFAFAGGEQAVIASDRRTPWDGDSRISIQLGVGKRENGIRAGAWQIELEARKIGKEDLQQGVRYDAWIERTIPNDAPPYMHSRFGEYDESEAITLTTPGTARRAITVGSCNNGDPMAVSASSGRGPTRDGRNKPEVAAPGEDIMSSLAGAGQGSPRAAARTQLSGTSMSAPHVVGIVARLLSRHRYLYASEIRDLLVKSAAHPDGAGAWDRDRGYGKVDAAKAMKLLEDRLAP
jgi:subtilisin family serine protease